MSQNTTAAEMPYRILGRTGERVSAIGLGGWHIGFRSIDDQLSTRIVRTAIDSGINFMDNSWDYNDGASEIRMGRALRDGYRQKVFLMTKIDGRTREAAARQIDESLRRLQTDRIDLMQFHEVIRLEDPDRIFASGGAIKAMVEARRSGKIRYIGFTGHKDPFILESKTVTPIECLHYALNLPTSTVITGIDSLKILDQALEAAKTFKPMSKEAVTRLLARTAAAAATGRFELFKTGNRYDGTAHNPQWLG